MGRIISRVYTESSNPRWSQPGFQSSNWSGLGQPGLEPGLITFTQKLIRVPIRVGIACKHGYIHSSWLNNKPKLQILKLTKLSTWFWNLQLLHTWLKNCWVMLEMTNTFIILREGSRGDNSPPPLQLDCWGGIAPPTKLNPLLQSLYSSAFDPTVHAKAQDSTTLNQKRLLWFINNWCTRNSTPQLLEPSLLLRIIPFDVYCSDEVAK
jgi:hypothetical protein